MFSVNPEKRAKRLLKEVHDIPKQFREAAAEVGRKAERLDILSFKVNLAGNKLSRLIEKVRSKVSRLFIRKAYRLAERSHELELLKAQTLETARAYERLLGK